MNHFIIGSILLMVTALLIVLIIIIYQQSSQYKHTKLNKQFSLVLWLDFAFLLTEIVIWIFAGAPGRFFRVLILLSNYLGLFFGIMSAVAFFVYIAISIPVSEKQENRMKPIAFFIILTYIVAIAICQKKGLLFSLDEGNNYIVGVNYYVPINFTAAVFLAPVVLVLFHRNKLGKKKTLIFISYSLIIIAGYSISIYLEDYPVAYVGQALSLLMVFVSIQIQQEKALLAKEAELRDAQIAIMLSQIQPHFLHNSLIAIAALCSEKPESVFEAILSFSDYLRWNMDSLSEKGLISFEKELAHTRQYLWFEELRFEERLDVIYDIQVDAFRLPPLTLQPIVENAVRHGITKNDEGGILRIGTKEEPDYFLIIVKDNGIGFDCESPYNDKRSHMGITNVRNRLLSQCGGEMVIDSKINKGTTVTMKIPKEK